MTFLLFSEELIDSYSFKSSAFTITITQNKPSIFMISFSWLLLRVCKSSCSEELAAILIRSLLNLFVKQPSLNVKDCIQNKLTNTFLVRHKVLFLKTIALTVSLSQGKYNVSELFSLVFNTPYPKVNQITSSLLIILQHSSKQKRNNCVFILILVLNHKCSLARLESTPKLD